ncbi:MAG: peptidylprolyl isomerase [Bacteroidales bacterium]|nr:peptidylprolyl isomerase [Bacteroidales bacterium]
MRKSNLTFITLFLSVVNIFSQPYVVDKVVGVVGKNQVLYSEVEEQYLQYIAQGVKPKPTKCEVFENILSQKLLANQAEIDSLIVDELTVEMELDDRIKYFINQIGTEEKLIEYFGKSILEIKEDMRDAVREQLLMQMMRREITSTLSVTPTEVRNFFKSLPEDSIPYIDAQVKINQIVVYPKSSEQAILDVRERLLNLRERIMNGEKFSTLAVLYSEGPSAARGGDIGWVSKADVDPAYFKAASALKEGQISKIVESEFGYHLIQLIERSDERIHTRHIIMKPKITYEEKEEALTRIDSIVQLVRLDTLTFERAAMFYSQDEDTRMNGGLRVNPVTGNTLFELDEFETSEHYIIRELKVGEISKPYESKDKNGKLVYKVIRIKLKTEPHKANLKQDYELLKQMTSQVKESEIVDKWVEDKLRSTYVKLNEPYNNCNFRIKGWIKD